MQAPPGGTDKPRMSRYFRALIAALGTLALCAPLAAADGNPSNHDDPEVWNERATDVTESSAILRARIDPEDDDGAEYFFQYGPGNYGKQTGTFELPGDDTRDVAVQITGLTPEAGYQFRALVKNDDGWTVGTKKTFATVRAAAESAGSAVAPDPALGKTVVVEVAAGEVFYRAQGSSEFLPLQAAAELPVNSVLDTTQGTVVLQTALPGGKTQDGSFWGGKFQVRQPRKSKGMTTIALRGGDFSACKPGSANRLDRKRRKGAIRKLWAKDKGGRFKTSGKGSVATVRGTSWFTAERCDGTLTRVTRGAVLVRERGSGQRKLLRRGQSFLAQLPRNRNG